MSAHTKDANEQQNEQYVALYRQHYPYLFAANYHYTAVFEKETLPQILHILQLILPFQYTINGTEVKINKDNINQ